MLGFWLMMSSAATFFHCTFFDSRFTHCVPSTTARKDSQKAAGRDRRGRAEPEDGGGGEPIFFAFSLHSPNAKRKMTNEKKKVGSSPQIPNSLHLTANFRGTSVSHPTTTTNNGFANTHRTKATDQYAELRKPRFQLDDGLKHFFLESNDPFHYCSFSSLAQW